MMRDLITIVESFNQWTEDQLFDYAQHEEGAIENEKTNDFVWHFDPAFPIDRISCLGCPITAEWMKDEISYKETEEESSGYYDDMFEEPIQEPIVIHIENGSGRIWDGCHRVGACVMQGIRTIPAVVGVRKNIL